MVPMSIAKPDCDKQLLVQVAELSFYCLCCRSFGYSGGGVIEDGSGFHAIGLAGAAGFTPKSQT